MAERGFVVVDLGFGDSGKGRTVDALCRREPVHTVLRFNGGAQAAHNVITPDGRHHCFAQWGSGSLAGEVATVLGPAVVVHPGALRQEAAALQRAGVADPWSRLHIDARCRVTTPFLQASGRLREWARGEQAHGSCGVGFGESVDLSQRHPELSLHWADLRHPARAMQKLQAQRERLSAEWQALALPQAAAELALLHDARAAEPWLADACALAQRCPPQSLDALAQRVGAPGAVVFEGAQGLLLDEACGFHPHTSWSDTRPAAAHALAAELGLTLRLRNYGLLRSYLTRHGAGPLPSEDRALDAWLPEPHNPDAAWSGRFRRGHADALLLRYALACAGPLDGLVLGHADALGSGLRSVAAYEIDGRLLSALPPAGELQAQQALAAQLLRARPCFDDAPLRSVAAWDAWARAQGAAPLVACASGPRAGDMHWYD